MGELSYWVSADLVDEGNIGRESTTASRQWPITLLLNQYPPVRDHAVQNCFQ